MQLKWPMLWDLFSLFPAHAGVILGFVAALLLLGTFPRTRGGDPMHEYHQMMATAFSPHTRG